MLHIACTVICLHVTCPLYPHPHPYIHPYLSSSSLIHPSIHPSLIYPSSLFGLRPLALYSVNKRAYAARLVVGLFGSASSSPSSAFQVTSPIFSISLSLSCAAVCCLYPWRVGISFYNSFYHFHFHFYYYCLQVFFYLRTRIVFGLPD